MTASTLAIRGQSLTKIYGSGNAEVTAIEDVSFFLSTGEVVALLGPSGAGKSTLLTIVGLINSPTSGRLFIGLIFQSFRRPTIIIYRQIIVNRTICVGM